MRTLWWKNGMRGVFCAAAAVGLGVTVSVARGAEREKQNVRPAEADLYLGHLKDAALNPKEEPGVPRVLLIGDSISIGYTLPLRRQLQGKANVFRPPANCQHTGFGLAHLKDWLGTNHWDVIHFNWGIWDSHMLDERGEPVRDEAGAPGPLHIRYTPEQYGENLTRLVDILQGTGARLIWASTTPVMRRTGARFEDIAIRNAIAARIMEARGIAIDDLYAYALPHAKEWQNADQVHFNDEGRERLADRVRECILHELATAPRPPRKPDAGH